MLHALGLFGSPPLHVSGTKSRRRGARFTGLVALATTSVGTASAHIELTEPLARYEITGADTGIKGCPCGIATGGGNSNRTCKVEQDGSDPNRNEQRVYTAPAGSKLVLAFNETIGHVGKYRVAFDEDGADFSDFNAHVLTELDDPQGSTGNLGAGNAWAIEVTLPNTPCTNCTLQLTQVMDASVYQNENVDWTTLASLSTYYACIDLVLTGDAPSTMTPAETGVTSEPAVTSDAPSTAEPDETSGRASTPGESVSTLPATSTAVPPATTSAPAATAPGTTNPPSATTTTGNPSGATSMATEGQPAPSAMPSAEVPVMPSGEEGGGCSVQRSTASSKLWVLGVLAAALFYRWRSRRPVPL